MDLWIHTNGSEKETVSICRAEDGGSMFLSNVGTFRVEDGESIFL